MLRTEAQINMASLISHIIDNKPEADSELIVIKQDMTLS